MKISSTALCGIVSLLLVVVCVNAFPLLDQSQVSILRHMQLSTLYSSHSLNIQQIQHNTAVDENDASNSLESILSESPHIRSARQVIDRGCVEACARYIYLLRRSRLRGPYFPSFYRQRYALHYLACRNRCIISEYR